MEVERSDSKTIGIYRIDSWRLNSMQTSMSLKDGKESLGNLPINTFDDTSYPNADEDIIGDLIPIAFGTVKGLRAYPIDIVAKKFKIVDHSIVSFNGFQDEDGVAFTPDSADAANAEFIYSAWDGSEKLYADVTAVGENPVDCVKLLLTDSLKGAGLSLSELDTVSTGNKGFGANGTRLEYIYATESTTLAEIVEFPIGLYINNSKAIIRWIEQVLAASFGILYVNLEGKYQIKSWKVATSEGVDEITDTNIKGNPTTKIVATDTFTKVISKFDKRHNTGDYQTVEFSDDRVRQLRGINQHRTLTQQLPLSIRFGARYWAERSVGMRAVPRRILNIEVTQEFMLKEPGDYVRINSTRNNINEVFEVLEVRINPGTHAVGMKLIDNRGHDLQPGFWVLDSLVFPASLGGGAITEWDSTWTDEQKRWAKENAGFWGSDANYIDQTDDTVASYRSSVWT